MLSADTVTLNDVAKVITTWTPKSFAPLLKPAFLFDDQLQNRAQIQGDWLTWQNEFEVRKRPGAVRLWLIEDCICFPPHMLLTTPHLEVIRESVRKTTLAKPLPWSEIDVSPRECALVVGSGQHRNYFHWMIEFATKATWFLKQFGHHTLVTPTSLPNFVKSSFDMLIGEQPDLLQISRPTRFKKLYFIENLAHSNTRLSPLVRDFYWSMRHRYTEGLPAVPPSRKLIVSRDDAATRRVLNEDLLKEAAGHGFQLIRSAGMSVREQAALFADASVIIGAHGANLTNMVFSPVGTKVIEIVPSTFKAGMTCYAALAEMFMQDYTLAVSPGVLNEDHPPEAANIRLGQKMIADIVAAGEVSTPAWSPF